VQDLHRELFGRLPPADLLTSENEPIVPGQLRMREVQVGQHVAPAFASVPRFLERWASFYGHVRRGEAALVALAAAHQRLGWIHPFIDGNGRVMRLHTHTLLHALGYTGGLWSPLRGFARSTDRYYALLADADSLRRGDLDGRGNLSEQALIAWIDYVLDTCLDQVTFMSGMLDFETLKARIEACLVFEASVEKSGVRQESLRGLHYLFLSGEEMTRGDFKSMLGMSDRGATDALGALVKRGLLKSDSPQGKVRFGLPQHALRFLFPRLWPEAEADVINV
jgi:Fic family protein